MVVTENFHTNSKLFKKKLKQNVILIPKSKQKPYLNLPCLLFNNELVNAMNETKCFKEKYNNVSNFPVSIEWS